MLSIQFHFNNTTPSRIDASAWQIPGSFVLVVVSPAGQPVPVPVQWRDDLVKESRVCAAKLCIFLFSYLLTFIMAMSALTIKIINKYNLIFFEHFIEKENIFFYQEILQNI